MLQRGFGGFFSQNLALISYTTSNLLGVFFANAAAIFLFPYALTYYRNTSKICHVILSYILGHMENEWFKILLYFLSKVLFAFTRNLAKLLCTLSVNCLSLSLLALAEYFLLCFLVFCFQFFHSLEQRKQRF